MKPMRATPLLMAGYTHGMLQLIAAKYVLPDGIYPPPPATSSAHFTLSGPRSSTVRIPTFCRHVLCPIHKSLILKISYSNFDYGECSEAGEPYTIKNAKQS